MFEPSMRELTATRDSIEANKGVVEDAKSKLDTLDSRVKRELLRLEEKEKDLEMRENQAVSKGQALALKEREHDRQGVQLNEQLTNLQAARLQVHEQQVKSGEERSDEGRSKYLTSLTSPPLRLALLVAARGAEAGQGR